IAAWLYFQVDWALAFQAKHVGDDPDRTVTIGNRVLSVWDFMRFELLPRLKPAWPRGFLAIQDREMLWSTHFVALVLLCWFASIWLQAVGAQPSHPTGQFLWSLPLSALGAVIAYHLVKFMPLGTLVSKNAQFGSWGILPLLGGLFAVS